MRWHGVQGAGVLLWKVLATGAVFSCAQHIGHGKSVPTIEDIQKAWNARQLQTHSARFKWTETRFIGTHTVPPARDGPNWPPRGLEDFLPEKDLTLKRTASLSFQGNMMRYEYHGQYYNPQRGGVRRKQYVSVFDGEVSSNFHGLKDIQVADAFPLSGFIRGKPLHWDYDNDYISALLVTYRACDPEMGGVDLAHYRVLSKLGSINGHRCLIVGPGAPRDSAVLYWVDAARGFLVLRVVRLGAGPLPLSTLDISYRRDQEHGWVPSGWKFVRTCGSRDRVFGQATAIITHHEINLAIPESEFQFEFPPDTAVTDGRTGRRYIARGGGIQRTVTREELSRGATYQELVATESGKAGLREPTSILRFWYFLLPVILAVVFLAYLRMRLP